MIEHLDTLSKKAVQALLDEEGLNVTASFNLDFYKVVSEDVYEGQAIKRSHLVVLPQTNKLLALLSNQHGTIFEQSRIPTTMYSNLSVLLCAQSGYFCVMADYLGYGSSQEFIHPYHIKTSAKQDVQEGIKALKNVLHHQKRAYTDELFLIGYSEGAFASLAYLEAFSNKPKAVAAMGGALDVKKNANLVVEHDSINAMAYVLLKVYSFHKAYGFFDFESIFLPTYQGKVLQLLDGHTSKDDINEALPKRLSELFTKAFLEGFLTSKAIQNMLEENTLTHVKHSSKLCFIHSQDDDTVPYFNTVNAHKHTLSELITLKGLSHKEALLPSYLRALEWFKHV